MINGVDPAAKTPNRVRRNWNRAIKGSITSTIQTTLPVTVDSQGRIIVDIATAGGLDSAASALQIKLDTNSGLAVSSGGLTIHLATNPGLQRTSGGLSLLLDSSPGLQVGSGGLSIKPDAAGAITVSASGVAVATDGVTIEISGDKIQIKNGSITGAKFGWAATKGDLLVFDGTSYVPLLAGADGTVLTADSTAPAGIKWA